MSSRGLLALYQSLGRLTREMEISAKTHAWDDFSNLEAQSVVHLDEIKNGFSLAALSTDEKTAVANEIQLILSFQEEIRKHAGEWRNTRALQQKSDAMSVKIANAYA